MPQQIIFFGKFLLPGLLLILMAGCTQTYSTEVDSSQKISNIAGNFSGSLNAEDQFGAAIANIGDLEVDGVTDLAVGAPFDDDNGTDRGALWILFMDSDGQVDISQKISDSEGGFTGNLDDNDQFGSAVTAIGDLNNDGVLDLAVGAPMDDDGGTDRGAIWILFLNADGTVRLSQKISDEQGGFTGVLDDSDQFGGAITDIGDLDNDGVTDLAVGVMNDDDGGTNRGAVWILFMYSDGSVKSEQKISFTEGGLDESLDNNDFFGSAVSAMGDLNGDGVNDLIVGTRGDDDGGVDRGAAWLLFMNNDGTVNSTQKISQTRGDFDGALNDGDQFGNAITKLGDLNDDGITDIAIAAKQADDGGVNRGAFWVLFLKSSGKVISSSKISDTQGNFKGNLTDGDLFGSALAEIGDLDGDGALDVVTGASNDDDGGINMGALWVLFMMPVDVHTDTDAGLDWDSILGRED